MSCVMETQIDAQKESPVRSFTLVKEKMPALLKYGTVTALTFGGIGFMMGGGLAWIAGETTMFVTFFLSGAIFVATGGAAFLKCLDES